MRQTVQTVSPPPLFLKKRKTHPLIIIVNTYLKLIITNPFFVIQFPAGKGLFGGTSFGQLAANVSSPTNTAASIFGGALTNTAQSTAMSSNIFGDKSITTT